MRKIEDEYNELYENNRLFKNLYLQMKKFLLGIIKKKSFMEIRDKYGDERRTAIEKKSIQHR